MGRPQAAYVPSLGRSCSLDRFATQNFFDDGKVYGGSCADAAGAGRVLPASTCPATPSSDEENVQEADREVVLSELWYHLPKEEQIRFGGCFSRMILKILNRCDGLSRENGA
jgi:hypothetical protein